MFSMIQISATRSRPNCSSSRADMLAASDPPLPHNPITLQRRDIRLIHLHHRLPIFFISITLGHSGQNLVEGIVVDSGVDLRGGWGGKEEGEVVIRFDMLYYDMLATHPCGRLPYESTDHNMPGKRVIQRGLPLAVRVGDVYWNRKPFRSHLIRSSSHEYESAQLPHHTHYNAFKGVIHSTGSPLHSSTVYINTLTA